MLSGRALCQPVVLVLLVGFIVAGFLLPLDGPDLARSLQPPSRTNWMGTDELGRDVAMRTVRASAQSLSLATAAWATAVVIGLLLGGYAGYARTSVGAAAVRAYIAIVYTTPFFLILVALVGALGPGLANVYIVVAMLIWVVPARQTAAVVAQIRQSTFVIAARSFGFSPGQIVRYVLMPEVYRPVVIASLAVLPEIMAIDAALSFFGLGAPPPTPTIGRMLLEGTNYLTVAWWVSVFPLLAIVAMCLGIRLVSQRGSS